MSAKPRLGRYGCAASAKPRLGRYGCAVSAKPRLGRYGCAASAKPRLGKFPKKNLMPGQKSAQKSNARASFHEL